MLEGAFTRKLLAALRAHPALKQAVIFKHADRFSAGVPDFSVSIGKHTEWFEVKVLPNRPTKLQKYYLNRLAGSVVFAVKGAAAHYIDYDGKALLFGELIEQIVIRCVNV